MKKLTKIWGIGLVVILVASLLLSAAPVAASELAWGSKSGTPSTSGNVLVSAVDINDLAVAPDGQTIWALDDEGATYTIYKSTNAGESWSTVTLPNSILIPYFVAIAPDDSDIVAIAGDTAEISVTIDGGSNWSDLGTIQEGSEETCGTMLDLAISPEDSGKHYVAVAGIDSSSEANVWYFNLGAAVGAWTDTEETTGFGHGVGPTIADAALAVAFSPYFASDKVMAALTVEHTGTDAVALELYSFSSSAWNDTGASFTGYPVTVATGTYTGAGTGAIVLSPEYLGSDDSMRLAFAGLDSTDASDDALYRLSDTSVKEMSTGKDIWSIDYDGTNLVAGQAGGHRVYRCADPLASSPTVSTSADLKSPGGTGCTNVVVAWNGSEVVAGVTGLSSSFDVSTDNGKSFNGLSLVQDATYDIHDFAVSADGSAMYISADDTVDFSIWRYASRWERVLVAKGNDCIIRLAPDDPDTIYVAETGDDDIWYSSEAGDNKWFARTMKANIQDVTVESADVLYAAQLTSKSVYQSTNGGFTWGSAKTAKCDNNIAMIKSLGEDELMVGDAGGDVSYSMDGYSTWNSIAAPFSSGAVQVTGTGLADGEFLYAATDATGGQNIVRWEMGQSGTSWTDIINGTLGVGDSAMGMELVDGVLYVLADDGVNSAFWRTLSPSSAGSTTTWSTANSSAEIFNSVPTALRVSSGSTNLWAVDTAADALFTFEDTVATTGPTLGGPADGAVINVNPVSGGTFSVSFSWSRLSKGSAYDLEISLDSSFAEDVLTPTISSTSGTVASVQAGTNFMPNTTYYWHVRTSSSGPIYSPWSETRSFTIAELPEAAAPVIIQQPPAPVIEVPPAPEIVLQPPDIILPAPTPAPEIVIPAAPAPAPAVPSWAIYAIIIIGAVLVIALIVLIMRTRRPV